MMQFLKVERPDLSFSPHSRGKRGQDYGSVVVKILSLSIALMAVSLAGCSTGLLGGGGDSAPTAQSQIQVNNQLAMPPDLSLAAPGSGVAPTKTYKSASLEPPSSDNVYGDAAPPVARAPAVDVYEKYGVNKLNPDGTKKNDNVLREELRQAVIAEKRKTNPNYGTIRNIGELFNDQ
jgi:hypothetical protein